MKTLLQHLLISFIGALLAIASFGGIIRLFHNNDEETREPLDEKVIAYFDAQGISYEKLDFEDFSDDLYSFSYNGNKYIWQYYPDDKLFLRILKTYEITPEMNQKVRVQFLERLNQIERKLKCVKIVLRDDWIYFSIECYVSRGGDIENVLSRSLDLLEDCIDETLEEMEKF
ncbi:MAG: hypothetical protein J6P74_09100 [Paludibacteraceae bacterium]|nr:hypothetical protein [Paludibacteraceae bacterium]